MFLNQSNTYTAPRVEYEGQLLSLTPHVEGSIVLHIEIVRQLLLVHLTTLAYRAVIFILLLVRCTVLLNQSINELEGVLFPLTLASSRRFINPGLWFSSNSIPAMQKLSPTISTLGILIFLERFLDDSLHRDAQDLVLCIIGLHLNGGMQRGENEESSYLEGLIAG